MYIAELEATRTRQEGYTLEVPRAAGLPSLAYFDIQVLGGRAQLSKYLWTSLKAIFTPKVSTQLAKC